MLRAVGRWGALHLPFCVAGVSIGRVVSGVKGRRGAEIQGAAGHRYPGWIPARVVGLDVWESLWYPGACREGHVGSFLWSGGAPSGSGGRLSACVAGVSIGRVFWQGKRGEGGGQMIGKVIKGAVCGGVCLRAAVRLCGVLLLALTWVSCRKFRGVDEIERDRDEDFDGRQWLA
ncbi:hypothetical protein ES708_17729 [subsurface metagenome]